MGKKEGSISLLCETTCYKNSSLVILHIIQVLVDGPLITGGHVLVRILTVILRSVSSRTDNIVEMIIHTAQLMCNRIGRVTRLIIVSFRLLS